MRNLLIRVPCSTSNIGPGFDVLGMTLSLFLEIEAELLVENENENENETKPLITYSFVDSAGQATASSSGSVSLEPSQNLIWRVAATCALPRRLPVRTLHIRNSIPLARGLGSSGAAIVAGVMLADVALGRGSSTADLLSQCLRFEHHPDNITAALVGGFVASYVRDNSEENDISSTQRDEKSGSHDREHGAISFGGFVRLPVASEIKAIAVVPQFELSTELARSLLPKSYSREDVVFNLQRVTVLTQALAQSPPNPELVHGAMADRMHQKYRQHLVPGLPDILKMRPADNPGLLGVCVSGAGPTVLVLAVSNFESLGQKVVDIFSRHSIGAVAHVLDIVQSGTVVTYK